MHLFTFNSEPMKHTIWFLAFFLVLFAGDRLGGAWMQKQTDDSQFRYSRLYDARAGADILLLGTENGVVTTTRP